MRWIDGHLDLAFLAVRGRDLRRACPPGSGGCVSLPALRRAGIEIAFGTIFTMPADGEHDGAFAYPGGDVEAAVAAGRHQLDVYRRLEQDGEISIVRDAGDLDRETPSPKIVILMEGADPIRRPEDAAWWHEQGLRLVGLTWAAGTRYAGGNAQPGPLTSAGVELVAALDELGVVHDASHLADESLDMLLDRARGRVVATHSNSRALMQTEDQRHLRDDQIEAIVARGGLVGLNLFSPFVARDGRATVADALAHVEHVVAVAGDRRAAALGSDMDGGFGPDRLVDGLDHPQRLPALAAALVTAGWSGAEIAGFAAGNWRTLLKETLPPAPAG